jgi:hypothetical protein
MRYFDFRINDAATSLGSRVAARALFDTSFHYVLEHTHPKQRRPLENLRFRDVMQMIAQELGASPQAPGFIFLHWDDVEMLQYRCTTQRMADRRDLFVRMLSELHAYRARGHAFEDGLFVVPLLTGTAPLDVAFDSMGASSVMLTLEPWNESLTMQHLMARGFVMPDLIRQQAHLRALIALGGGVPHLTERVVSVLTTPEGAVQSFSAVNSQLRVERYQRYRLETMQTLRLEQLWQTMLLPRFKESNSRALYTLLDMLINSRRVTADSAIGLWRVRDLLACGSLFVYDVVLDGNVPSFRVFMPHLVLHQFIRARAVDVMEQRSLEQHQQQQQTMMTRLPLDERLSETLLLLYSLLPVPAFGDPRRRFRFFTGALLALRSQLLHGLQRDTCTIAELFPGVQGPSKLCETSVRLQSMHVARDISEWPYVDPGTSMSGHRRVLDVQRQVQEVPERCETHVLLSVERRHQRSMFSFRAIFSHADDPRRKVLIAVIRPDATLPTAETTAPRAHAQAQAVKLLLGQAKSTLLSRFHDMSVIPIWITEQPVQLDAIFMQYAGGLVIDGDDLRKNYAPFLSHLITSEPLPTTSQQQQQEEKEDITETQVE